MNDPEVTEQPTTTTGDGSATLTDEEIETRPLGPTPRASVDDDTDTGDDSDTGDDAGDDSDTGDDTGDEADPSDAGDDTGDDSGDDSDTSDSGS